MRKKLRKSKRKARKRKRKAKKKAGKKLKKAKKKVLKKKLKKVKQAKKKASAYTCISEQHILTQMHKERPGLFNFVDKGYGSMAADLVTQMYENHGSDSALFDMLTGEEEGDVTTPL